MYVQIERRTTRQKPAKQEWTRVYTRRGTSYWRWPPQPRPPVTRLVFRLVKSVRTERGPRPVLVAELGRIHAEDLDRVGAQHRLWTDIDQRLAEHGVSGTEAERIRARIAQHVRRPDDAAVAANEAHFRQLEDGLKALAQAWRSR